MVSPQEIYEWYLIKSEKNSTNDNYSTDRGKFVVLYNELAPRMVKWYLNNRNRDDIKDIEILLIDDKKIEPKQKHLDHVDFEKPKDFLSWSFARAIASKGKCQNEEIDLFEIKDEDRGRIMNNSLFSPSFDYREAPYTYSEGNIKIYKEKGVDITTLYLSYYRYPTEIKLLNPENPESDFAQTSIELPKEVINRIISAMVGDFKINNEDPSFQVEKVRQYENLQ